MRSVDLERRRWRSGPFTWNASEFGAAGSMLVILLWVHTAAAVLFYGAEFTKVYATAQGRGVIPSKRAVLRATGDDTTAR
jgi:uncharacterized BrkB/YihY/UPF0761 family membrane protein